MIRRFLFRIFPLLWLLPCALTAAEGVTFSNVQIHPDGSFTYAGQLFRLTHWDTNWNPVAQDAGGMTPLPGFPEQTDDAALFEGNLQTGAGIIHVREEFRIVEDDALAIRITLQADPPVPTNLAALVLSLREEIWKGKSIRLDGEDVQLPEECDNLTIFYRNQFSSFELWSPDGLRNLRLASNAPIELQDSRKFPCVHEYNLRLPFPSDFGRSGRGVLELKLKKCSPRSSPIDIRSVVNRGFRDEVSGDGEGGWTDQGPGNDLAQFPTGTMNFGGINFEIINPSENDGNSCLVFQNNNLDCVEIPLNGKRIPYLCVLHAFAWVMGDVRCHVGDIEARYTDGTVSRFPVFNTVDGNDWWTPVPVQNGRLAWRGQNKSATVGVFLAAFKLEEKPVKTLVFLPEHPRVWMIAGLSASDAEPSPAFSEPPLIFEAGEIWRPLQWSREIEPGSILDFSERLNAPAGKYGRVVADRNGNWVFQNRPNQPIRFYGVNLSMHGGFPDKATAELVAKRFAAYGINAVRIHHHDNILTGGGSTGSELVPEWIDRLDYFFHCLKQRGIYMITDLYASRSLPAGAVPWLEHAAGMNEWKGALMVDAQARENHKKFVRNWLEHVNAYTGIAWKDDPALIAATNVNEGNFDHWLKEGSERTRRLFESHFEQFLSKHQFRKAEMTPEELEKLRITCIAELHRDFYLEMKQFVRSLGAEFPLTDLNMGSKPWNTLARGHYDFADNHFYVEHPTGIIPFRLENVSQIGKFGGPLTAMIPCRISGKPFTVTEFNWVFPARFRGESGVLTGAYAALQNWSGLWRYTYSHPERTLSEIDVPVTFDFNSDPINLLSDRIGQLLFVRGDVAAAGEGISILLPDEDPGALPEEYPESLEQLGLICHVESLPPGNDAEESDGLYPVTLTGDPDSTVPFDASAPDFFSRLSEETKFGEHVSALQEGVARSVTGELELNRDRGTFRVVTPRTEVMVHSEPGELNGKFLKSVTFFENSVLAVSSMDGAPLKTSGRMLILHLTDVMNSGGTFADSRRQIYISQGKLPLLGRYGRAVLELLTGTGEFELYAVDFSGRRISGPLEFEMAGDRLRFTADTFALDGEVVFAYELLRK